MARARGFSRRWRAAPARHRLGLRRAAAIASLVLGRRVAAAGRPSRRRRRSRRRVAGAAVADRTRTAGPGAAVRRRVRLQPLGARTTRSSTRTTPAARTCTSSSATTDRRRTRRSTRWPTGGTTCDQHLDLASYWAPALLDHRAEVVPLKAVAYYRPGVGIDPATVEPYPYGLEMLGGDQVASAPQSLDVVAWSCGTGSARSATPPTCPAGRPLRVAISFPDCWDGEHLDSADHSSPRGPQRAAGACPDEPPGRRCPQLLFDDHATRSPVRGTTSRWRRAT